MRKCDSCLYGEKLYDGTLICQHIVSMQGKEATQDYVICNSVAKCDFFLETNIKCSDCKGSCYAIQRKLNCKKMEVLKNEKNGAVVFSGEKALLEVAKYLNTVEG